MKHEARMRRLQDKARMRRRTSAIPTHTDDEIEAAALDAAEEIAQRLAAGEPLRRWDETLPDGTAWTYDDETILAAAREYRERRKIAALKAQNGRGAGRYQRMVHLRRNTSQ